MAVIPQYELTQEMIDAAIETHEPLRLLYGVYNVAQTLRINQCCGLRVVGAGLFDPTSTGPGWSQLGQAIGTKLLWTGPTGGTMLDITSSMDTRFDGVCADGNHSAAIGLGCWTINGWPNSATHVRNATIQNFTQAGVQFGKPSQPSGWNSDLSIMENVTFDGSPIGIQVCNDQSVGHVWSNITHGQSNKVCISLDQGGQVMIRGINQNGNPPRTFLRLGEGGCNVATVLISGGHVEAGTLIDASASPPYADWVIHLESILGTAPTPVDWPIIKASANASITSAGCKFNGRGIQSPNFSGAV